MDTFYAFRKGLSNAQGLTSPKQARIVPQIATEDHMDNFFRELMLHNEALCVEHNIPITRRFTHAELEPAIHAIREIEAAKLQELTPAQIDRAMLELIKGAR
jgi:hypothetical protein